MKNGQGDAEVQHQQRVIHSADTADSTPNDGIERRNFLSCIPLR
jgi:hypothetical protein